MIGIDIVRIERFEKFLNKFEEKAFKRFLCEEEILLVKSASTAAGFFAAKEAVSKALGVGISKECGFYDIRLYKDAKNAPYFTLSKNIVDKFQITQTKLSITHDGGFAVAVAIIESAKKQNHPVFHST